jgi:nucleotide-binding universal stress UspA family protein
MFSNVLIGVDGKQGGRDAIALARTLAAPDARLALAHVDEIPPERGATEALPFERTLAREMLERERERAKLDAERVAVAGPMKAGQGLHVLAEDRGSDLLVVGSTRHSALGRVLMGDDTAAALNGAPCAGAVAPRGYAAAPHALHRIGVGYDHSPESETALSVARALAAREDGSITVVRVVTLSEVSELKPIPRDWPEAIDELVEREADDLAKMDGLHSVVIYGGAMEELAQIGKGLDLLLVGSRGYGPFGRLVHGSVSRYLLRHASCPLIVLTRGAAVPSADGDVAPASAETAVPATR